MNKKEEVGMGMGMGLGVGVSEIGSYVALLCDQKAYADGSLESSSGPIDGGDGARDAGVGAGLEDVLLFWDEVVASHQKLAPAPYGRRKERVVCDVQLELGYMHSGEN